MLRGSFQPMFRHFLAQIASPTSQAFLGICLGGLLTANSAYGQVPKTPTKAPLEAEFSKPVAKPLLKTGSQGTEVTELQALLKLLGYYTGRVTGIYDEGTASAVANFQKAASLSVDGIVGAETWGRLLPPSPVITANAPAATVPPRNFAESFPAPTGMQSGTAQFPNKPTPSKPSTTKAGPAQTGGETGQAKIQEPATFPILRLGMKGPAVEGLQERLKSLGFLKGAADGVFGPETQAAVKAAQRRLSLEPDGVVGNSTWIGLLR
ncbi:putative peptidoglycan-binding domain-containing protein [Leptolyngbyaceae cyanobacterium JSC-12]|nr:putative peptidoglycan-binding domain-containing protein [Leptolyngbyaceae cyanobacterium JSC-12]